MRYNARVFEPYIGKIVRLWTSMGESPRVEGTLKKVEKHHLYVLTSVIIKDAEFNAISIVPIDTITYAIALV